MAVTSSVVVAWGSARTISGYAVYSRSWALALLGDLSTDWISTEGLAAVGAQIKTAGGAASYTWEGTWDSGTTVHTITAETSVIRVPTATLPGFVSGPGLPPKIRLTRNTGTGAGEFLVVERAAAASPQ